jgi:hypothetical protein
LVAFAATNRVTVVAMRPLPVRIMGLNKHLSCRKNAIPYVAWGYGLTPIKCREKTVPLLAVAWDSIIQLIYIDEDSNDVGCDGFYYTDSEKEITSINFMGDGILVAVIDKTTKVLYTTKFKTGEYI